MKTEIRNVNKEQATEMLKKNFKNRKIGEKHVNFLAAEMTKGNWSFDGQPIRFDEYGRLLDGQHRLNAIIKSDTTQQFLIVSGLKEESFQVMDTGKNRSGGDVFSARGEQYSTDLAACSRFIIAFKRGKNTSGEKISNTDLVNWFEQNENIIDLIKESDVLYIAFSRVITKSWIASLKYLTAEINILQSEQFFNSLCHGLALRSDDPIYVLRKKLIDDKISTAKLSSTDKIAIIIKAWNLFRKGKTCKIIRFNKEIEKYPKFI